MVVNQKDILWNFKKLTMKFQISGVDFELKGTELTMKFQIIGVDFELKGTDHGDFVVCLAENISLIL